MSDLIVIQIVPQAATDPTTFTEYLTALGGLQITAFDLSFVSPVTGQNLGSASYIAPTGGWVPEAGHPDRSATAPTYPAGITNGIVQQVDFTVGLPAYYQLESVAIAVIEIPSPPPTFENLRLVAQWGAGAGAQPIPVPTDYYDVTLAAGPTPAPDSWASLSPSLYISLPVPPTAANPVSFQMPTDGTPPAFDALLTAVQSILADDPGAAVNVPTVAPATAAGGTILNFASTSGIAAGMAASGAGIPAGTTVTEVGATSVTVSQEVSAIVAPGTVITFAADLANLSLDECRNVAYEIVWSQQPPLPTPPDPIEELYTNPPNTGSFLSGSTPNTFEGDRQQFEAQLQGYYALPDATADRLTNFIFSLSAAIACEAQSLSATQALLEFPVSPGQPSNAPVSETEVILTGLGGVSPPTNFGVPAAYFYALGASMPSQITPSQRYQSATLDNLPHLLSELTSAINAATVSDSETFVTLSPTPPPVNAAQAARRIAALGIPTGSSTPLAPLDTVALLTSADTPSGNALPFASTTGVAAGMSVAGTNIPGNTTVTAATPDSVSLSNPVLGDAPSGTAVTFTPPFTPRLRQLAQAWLAFPPPVAGPPSSQTYQPSDDASKFWPATAALYPDAFLSLVLSALTQGYVLPAPFNRALGDEITAFLATLAAPAQPTVATLASVTAQQWTGFFQTNPTWLPPGSGNLVARIQAFILSVKTFFEVQSSGLPSSIILATTAGTGTGGVTLQFASTTGIVPTMSVSGTNIPPGTQVVLPISSTSVTLSQGVLPPGVSLGTTITFTPNYLTAAASASQLPVLKAPSTDWLSKGLSAAGYAAFGTGFNVATLQAAAAQVFPLDQSAQDWLVDALLTLDNLYRIVNPIALPPSVSYPPIPPSTFNPLSYRFSLVEALYARGFTSAADITDLPLPDFRRALAGSIADLTLPGPPVTDLAGEIWNSAALINPPPPPPPPPGSGFHPVNEGSLTNCIPPDCLSPLGPVAYLSEMLQATQSSSIALPTSANTLAGSTLPFGSTAGVATGMSASGTNIPDGTVVSAVAAGSVSLSQPISAEVPAGTGIVFTSTMILGPAIAQRRGPVGNLAATCANCETPLPLIDIVNECLEFVAATSTASGTVYDTAADALAGYALCKEACQEGKKEASPCHDPATIFAALPEYSTPATPSAANSAIEPLVYNKLKVDFSSCCLPYSQAIDVSRTYLRHFRTCRFEEMRTFRKCITEFVLDPVNEPVGFQHHLWRYPVRIDTAIEYLAITPEEYVLLFQGAWPRPCGEPVDRNLPQSSGQLQAWQLYGFASADGADPWTTVVVKLPEFLRRTCLSYCEFLELWKSAFVVFSNGGDADGVFPDCEPCCLDKLWLQFPAAPGAQQALYELAVFIRLWKKLKEACGAGYSFDHLRDICDVLQLFIAGSTNPDFIRQLAAFQILRDQFRMSLADPADKPAPGAVDADRTWLLALWVGPTAAKWPWAVRQLIERIEHHAQRHHKCDRRGGDFVKLLASNLDPLSRLAGFDPSAAQDSWHALPTHTLRFAEILAKIYASTFSIGELLYLFTAQDHLDGEDPFALQEENEALDTPLDLPDGQHEHSLWALRRRMLEVRVSEEEAEHWTWKRIEAVLREEFGFAPGDLLVLGQHFFPGTLEQAGYQADPTSRRYFTSLPPASTSAAMWNTPPDGPFQYDPGAAQQLWTQLPLTDEAVIAKLTHVHSLNAAEQQAVQDLYFQPRASLAAFALLFTDFAAAEKYMIEEREEKERWAYFRRQFALCHKRCRIIADHLSQHVALATGREAPEGAQAALLLLRELYADENAAIGDWENDAGTTPPVTWTPPPNGGAFAALLGLTGTGLVGEYAPEGGAPAWRDVSAALSVFGHERNKENCPVPTVLPSMSLQLTPQQMQFVSVLNGFAMKDATGAWLGGAEGFEAKWSGALLVEQEGGYEFWAGAPTPEGETPEVDAAARRRWRVTVKRGQKEWIILRHQWPGEPDHRSSALWLKRGVYELIVEFAEPAPSFLSEEQARAQHTGLQVKYAGPDTHDRRVEIPHDRLFAVCKHETLGSGIKTLSPAATAYLGRLYVSSLRDIRRTYQRAFKALLFIHRFGLSAKRLSDRQSELGYMLQQKANFAGVAYYRSGGAFAPHRADFDFNFLPLLDDYHPPSADSRAHPSPQRIQAMFDWWERIFDYDRARNEVRRRCERHLWLLFDEAFEKQPAHPDYLLRHMGADSRHWPLDLHYFQDQNSPIYAVTSADLEDERWVLRAWHADQWIRALLLCFHAKDITKARPDLWASDDPSAGVPGEAETGNQNLSAFLCDGCFDNGDPRRYDDVRRLNDGLRERGRKALLDYLCRMNRVALPWLPGRFATVPRELSDLLLLDVETGICERTSRIEEAITAVQNFVGRARLHLEPGWPVNYEFARLWDRQFATFRVWQACKRRHLYKENFVEWDELERARRVEAFRFLESELRSSALTVAVPGGLEWWPDQRPPAHRNIEVLEKREPSEIRLLPAAREGLNLLGTPERDARPSWLSAVQSAASGGQGDSNQPAAAGATLTLPFWMEAAIRLGTRFYRIAASGAPPAAMGFEPHKGRGEKDCVECCAECGKVHPALVDEYYFWLIDGRFHAPPQPNSSFPATSPDDYQYGYQDDYYDPTQQQSAFWQDPLQLPQLLEWPSSPMVRLAWCRVHNGEFQQPRRSVKGVAVASATVADLIFGGRTADSLTFAVTNALASPPVPGHQDPSTPGFRYDLAADDAVVLPLVTVPPAAPGPYPGGLPAYPYFVFVAAGTHLFPLSLFSPSLAVASALRAHCRFEAALEWYRLPFDPLTADCTWIHCPKDTPPPPPPPPPPNTAPNAPGTPAIADLEVRAGPDGGACCDSTDVSCAVARNRSIVLHYAETLREWGDAVMRRNSPEAFQHARLIFDTIRLILGKRPGEVLLPEPAIAQKVGGFKPYFAPLNSRLLDLYDTVEDRLGLIHHCMNSRRLHNGKLDRDMPYFGDNPLREGWRTAGEVCADEAGWCHLHSPYRFLFLVQKAQELAGKVREFGGACLAAFEKGDAEYLESLRAGHERELFTLGMEARKDQWRDADWQIEALQKTKAISQINLQYYNNLIQTFPINSEIAYQALTITSTVLRGVGNISEGIAEGVGAVPNMFDGIAGFGGTPLFYTQLPVGTPLASVFATAARIMNSLAEIASSTAGLELTEAGWQRRLDDWINQTQILPVQIEQIEQQILGAQRRRGQALQELNSQQRQVEQSAEIQDFLRDKFTAHDLYLFLQKETAALYYKAYDLALQAARQAERAFNFERGHTTRRFIPEEAWDTLHGGLMAGERLDVALRHMEKSYLDLNIREYELTKHISLRQQFPMQYLQLRTTGYCEVDIPEWMFDLDYPGMFMRRIKTVTLTIPCVTGPYTGVHCRLTLLSSITRIDPRLKPPADHCCCDHRRREDYETCLDDPRIVRQYAAREAIATSSGRNDGGMFELNFQDERYLPFEYLGAVSRWRIELPRENNYFDMDTVSDLILHLNYTAREGGDLLRRAANHAAQRNLPGEGWVFFEVKHDFPDAWELFRGFHEDRERGRELNLRLRRNMFPFIPDHRELRIDKTVLLFNASRETENPCQTEQCPCPEPKLRDCHDVAFIAKARREAVDRKSSEIIVPCLASAEWPDLYYGVFDTDMGPLGREDERAEAIFRFGREVGGVTRMFAFCHYVAAG